MAHEVEPGYIRSARYQFTRPTDTTPYSIGDALANSSTAASVVPIEFKVAKENGGAGLIIGAQLLTDSATAFAAIRLHLFNRKPFADAGYQADNSAIALTYAAMRAGNADQAIDGDNISPHGVPNKLPIIDFTTFTAQTSSAMSIGQCDQTELPFVCAPNSKLIYGLLEVRAAFTPANGQSFTAILNARGFS